MKHALLAFLLPLALACDSNPIEYDTPYRTCEETVCNEVPQCYPAIMTEPWDWSTYQSCLDTFECGADETACKRAMWSLECDPQKWEDMNRLHRAMIRMRIACGVAQ